MDITLLLYERVRLTLLESGHPKRLIVGVSGGADSMALLDLLARLKAELSMSIFVVHVHHGLRKTADGDMHFVISECEKRSIPCEIRRVVVPDNGSVEAAAREARYAAFASAYEQARADALVLAHHADDQAETLLMRLMRGSGAQGMGGMRVLSERRGMKILRPLLDTTREALRRYLDARGLLWREDETNADPGFLRNDLRLNVLPLIAARAPAMAKNCAVSARLLADEDAYLNGETARFLENNACLKPPCRFIDRAPFELLDVAMRRRVIREFAKAAGVMEFAKTEEILASLKERRSIVNLTSGWRLMLSAQRIHLLPPGEPNRRPPLISEWLSIASPEAAAPPDGKMTQMISPSLFDRAELRYRQSGDVIIPFGQTGEKKLKDFLIDRGIDRPFRSFVPLLAIGREVIFILGVGASEKLRLSSDESAVCLRVIGRLPWER